MPVEHWMMFGTFAEQRYFEYPELGTYQGIIINANMVAHAPAGLASFLLEKTAGQSKYMVDPLTHAFQHDPSLISNSEGEPKSSIKGLAEEYGEPFCSLVGQRPILPADFANTEIFQEFIEKCIRFQRDHLRDYMKKSDAAKYLEEIEIKPPDAVIAPYFYLTETTLDHWLDINIRSVQLASSLIGARNGLKLFAAVVVSQGIIVEEALRKRVVQTFHGSGVKIDGFLLWVDNLDEQLASGAELRGMLELAQGLRNAGKYKVINLHGGYFSILAGGAPGDGAFSGVTHGPEFGESRSVVPVGGGIPIARYYIPQLHARVRYPDALRIISRSGWLKDVSSFHSNVCDCDKCKEIMESDPANFQKFGESNVRNVRRKHGIIRIEFPTGDAKIRCLCHYLQRKKREYDDSSNAPKDTLLGELEIGEEKFRQEAGLEGVAHLHQWRKILQ